MRRKLLLVSALMIAGLWLWNASLFHRPPAGTTPQLIAHRGLAQTYSREGLTNETCTAARIHAPEHPYLENTIASMAAAFDLGAAVVELDVHQTPDGSFAVFHDWTLDCRTEASGVTHETPMSVLETLDIGYGYTADSGTTYPFRGKFVGAMPTLTEVFDTFPDGSFLINFKSNNQSDGDALNALFELHPEWRARSWGIYGGTAPSARVSAATGLPWVSRPLLQECLVNYLATGWSGHVPEVCEGMIIMVPINYAPLLWGWPHRFTQRMAAVGSPVVITGPYERGDPGTVGIDTPEDFAKVPVRFDGYIWTDRIDRIAPLRDTDG